MYGFAWWLVDKTILLTFHDFVIVRSRRQKRQCVFLQEVICQQPAVKSDPEQPVFAEECYLMTIICVCSGPVCEETLNKSAALECESIRVCAERALDL